MRDGSWSPWSGLFTRPITSLVHKSPLLFADLLAHSQPRSVLEIGCGLGRSMLEAQEHMSNASGSIPCATGMSFLNYTHYIYGAVNRSEPTLDDARRQGLSALFEEGPLDPSAVQALRKRFRLRDTAGHPPPTIVDADYNHGLPFPAESYDLILEQGAIKWEDPVMLPDPERHVEDYGRFLLDEVVRRSRLLRISPRLSQQRLLLRPCAQGAAGRRKCPAGVE